MSELTTVLNNQRLIYPISVIGIVRKMDTDLLTKTIDEESRITGLMSTKQVLDEYHLSDSIEQLIDTLSYELCDQIDVLVSVIDFPEYHNVNPSNYHVYKKQVEKVIKTMFSHLASLSLRLHEKETGVNVD